ncbi:uncharacterized protein DNG_08541 [Cephalotrichum gorgonifer]|uniref:Uncharacterized protein n=1 Tax=Cephalotrichum gorgonifer TaxID=2041049 RepID=A0AAE8N5B0_9PEZI|nr:uncharacterized protein DNG_08541 [Cephalotrichum gorgonifer]
MDANIHVQAADLAASQSASSSPEPSDSAPHEPTQDGTPA